MTNKLTLNDEIQAFLNTDDKDLWTLILENKTDDIKSLPLKEDNDLYKIVSELLSEGESRILNEHDFLEIKEGNSSLFRDMVRLILALDINGEHHELKLHIGDKLFDAIPDIVKNLREQSKGYPQNPINALVWSEGAGFRSCLNALIYYYRLKEDDNILHFLIMNRTQITLSIMGHYKNLVGPDMIESAKMKERLGDINAALSFYKAVEADFKNELTWFIHSPETGPNDEDVVTLESLKEALISIDRLSNTNEYSSVYKQIDEVLSREHVEVPDFDEEDEDE